MNLIDPGKILEEKEGVVEIKNYLNKIKIIKHLYTNSSDTATAIGSEVGISLPTVNALLTSLLKSGQIIKQGQGESQGGRKPDLYGLAADSFFILSLDVSKFKIRAAIYNPAHEAVTDIESITITLNNEEGTLHTIMDFIENIIKRSGLASHLLLPLAYRCRGSSIQKKASTTPISILEKKL